MAPEAEARILLVEDSSDDVVFLERAFKKAGVPMFFRVIADGLEARNYLAGQGSYADRSAHPVPSHLLLDLKLPKLSGLELLAWLRNGSGLAKLPVAILSSSGEPADIKGAKELGIDGYFQKPQRTADLVETVRNLARIWRLPYNPA